MSVWAFRNRLATAKHYLWSSLQDSVWSVQFGRQGTSCSDWLLSPIRTKWVLVGESRGVSLCLCPPRLLSSGPQSHLETARVQGGHVLVFTLPQWPCWAQHLESHKKHYCPTPGIICPQPQRLRENQNVNTPQTRPSPLAPTLRALRGYIFQIPPLSSLPICPPLPPLWGTSPLCSENVCLNGKTIFFFVKVISDTTQFACWKTEEWI